MAEPTPAETIRAAAIRLREAAERATPGPWAIPVANVFRVVAPEAEHTNQPSGLAPPYPWRIVAESGDETTAAADAAYIALVSPAVGKALADWLDFEASMPPIPKTRAHALTIARALLTPSGEEGGSHD